MPETEGGESGPADGARAVGCLPWLGILVGVVVLVLAAVIRATAETGVLGPDAESDPSGEAVIFNVVGAIILAVGVGLLVLRVVIRNRRNPR